MTYNNDPAWHMDLINDLISYSISEYPEPDLNPNKSTKIFRERSYQKMIVNELITTISENVDKDFIDIIENYQLVYEHFSKITQSDIYRIQLAVIQNFLEYLVGRYKQYGL